MSTQTMIRDVTRELLALADADLGQHPHPDHKCPARLYGGADTPSLAKRFWQNDREHAALVLTTLDMPTSAADLRRLQPAEPGTPILIRFIVNKVFLNEIKTLLPKPRT